MSHCKHEDAQITHVGGNHSIKARCNTCGLSTETSEPIPAKWICRLLTREFHKMRAFQYKAIEELQIVEREIGVPSEALKLLASAANPHSESK